MLVALAGAIWWFGWRTLPETSGTLSAPISAAARIHSDALGVPHIEAANWEDAIFLQGFATAQDRMWQMDALRRLAAGELAEVVGVRALESDQEARRLRLQRIAENHERTLPAEDRKIIAAYARGVNFYLETHRNKLPFEFALLGYDPRPWTVKDSLLAALQMHRNLTTSWKDDWQKRNLLVAAKTPEDRARIDVLFPPRAGWEPQPGSNAWAVAGSRTASGKPILSNDPHLEFSAPSTWHQVHLKAPGLNVIGVALPGIPAVVIGHNEKIAWGVTNLHYDVQDLYEERFDQATGRYQFGDRVEGSVVEQEPIAVKGEKTIVLPVFVTRHGPVIVTDGPKVFALRWAAAEPGSFQFPFLELSRASNWDEFRAALKRFPGPGQNFVYADTAGNIGYQATGLLPIRRGFDGTAPLDGASGTQEWAGYIPFEALPSTFNPAGGRIVTANQNPFPPDYPFAVNGTFAPPYRATQIATLLDARKSLKPEDMLVVQKDVYSGFSLFLAQQAIAAAERTKATNPAVLDAVAVLKKWNGQMEKGLPAPVITAQLFIQVRKAIADRAVPGKGSNYDFGMATAVMERLLRERPKDWFADWDQMLIKSLDAAIIEGAKSQGSRIADWDYGRLNLLTINQPVGGQLPVLGSYFNIGPYPMSGSSTTVKQTTRRLGPSMRMVVDLADLDKSLNNITIGESAHFLSGHYKDQWDAYYAGTSFPMQFGKVEAKSTLTVQPLK